MHVSGAGGEFASHLGRWSRLHAQLGETDPLLHVPAPVMSRHVLFLLLSPPSAMFIDLDVGGGASLDPREMVLDEGVGPPAV